MEERITLTTDDGWKLNARYLKAAETAPTVLLIHSQKNDLTEWNLWFDYLKRYGYGYLAMDLRGHGLSFVMPNGSTTTASTMIPGMAVRFGSARMTSSSTSSSTTMITRSAANAASFWQPSRPHI